MTPLLVAYLIVAALALVQSAVMLLAAWEHRRYAHSRARQPVWYEGDWPPVTVFAPCKGLDLGWEENFRALLEQDYPQYSVVFVVESESDPAFEAINQIIPRYPTIHARVQVAGLAADCGQKIHNLRRATETLDDQAEILAFVDSDARPPRLWLRRLVHRLRKSGSGAVTGYRWFIPARNTWTNRLLVCLNSAVAGLLGPHRLNMIWGGSWAIHRRTFEKVGIHTAWAGRLSDDLIATRAMREQGESVSFEPHCWLPGVVDVNLAELFRFARRQYVIARLHTPTQWWLALGGTLLRTIAFWLGAALIVPAAITGAAWQLPTTMTLLMYATTAGRAYLRHNAVAPFLPQHRDSLRRSMLAGVLGAPLISLIELAVLAASACGSRIHWRGVQYEIHRDCTVTVHREPCTSKQQAHSACDSVVRLDHAVENDQPSANMRPHSQRDTSSWQQPTH